MSNFEGEGNLELLTTAGKIVIKCTKTTRYVAWGRMEYTKTGFFLFHSYLEI
jgi:hypothetical protein